MIRESANPTDVVWDVLINELPKTAADDLARAVVGHLANQGWSIVRTDDHISKADLQKLADDIDKRGGWTDRDTDGFRNAATSIQFLIDRK